MYSVNIEKKHLVNGERKYKNKEGIFKPALMTVNIQSAELDLTFILNQSTPLQTFHLENKNISVHLAFFSKIQVICL